jgi:hypothetical protein
MSQSVTMATTRLPSTTGSGPFSFWIISLAASTTLIDGEAVAGSEVMTSRTLGILFAFFIPGSGYKTAYPQEIGQTGADPIRAAQICRSL